MYTPPYVSYIIYFVASYIVSLCVVFLSQHILLLYTEYTYTNIIAYYIKQHYTINILCVCIGLLSYTDSLEEGGGGGRGESNGYLNTISEKQLKKGHNSDLLSGENNNSNNISILKDLTIHMDLNGGKSPKQQ